MRNRSVKSSWTCWPGPERGPRRALVLVLSLALTVLVLAPGVAEAKKKSYDRTFLLQPLLGPENAQWLIGPIARMAESQEIDAYLALTDDEAAEAFIEGFWEKRKPYPERADNPLRKTFDERADQADKKFDEGTRPGRSTDRGTVWVLHGEPEKIDYEVAEYDGAPPIELWRYPKGAEKGLDGEKPEKWYRFTKIDGHMVFYDNKVRERLRREFQRRPPRTRPTRRF